MVGRGEAPPLSVECITEGVEGDYAVLNDEARLKVLPLSKIKAAKHLHAQGQKNMEATLRQLHAMGEGAYLHEALHAKHADLLKYLLYPLHDALSVCTKAHLERCPGSLMRKKAGEVPLESTQGLWSAHVVTQEEEAVALQAEAARKGEDAAIEEAARMVEQAKQA